MQLTTQWIDTIVAGKSPQLISLTEQYQTLMGLKENEKESVKKQIVKRAQAYKFVHQPLIASSTRAAAAKSSEAGRAVASVSSTSASYSGASICYGPTMALLKLQLGKQFTGNIRADFTHFLKHYFTPVDWDCELPIRKKIMDAGVLILANREFVEQMIEIIEQEENFLRKNHDYMVLYHAAEHNVLQTYSFINLWQARIKEMILTELPVIQEMRLFEFMKQSIESIDVFLIKMRRNRNDDNREGK